LNWLGVTSRVFNVGNYRRTHIGAGQNSDFFNPDNKEAAYGSSGRVACEIPSEI
jgi:6-phosphofructo-2-kinase / fructose-2,6-biphosphatase 2